MIESKAAGGSSTAIHVDSASAECCCCCMCGDYGLSSELFRCKVCQFRSQHRYCSNQYPKAESYGVCNWCLLIITDQKADEPSVGGDDQKTQYSSNSSSSCRNSATAAAAEINDQIHHDQVHPTIKTKKKINHNHQHGGSITKDHRRLNLKIQLSSPIKKHKLQLLPEPAQSPSSAARKRIMTSGGGSSNSGGGMVEGGVIRNKSKVEGRSNGGGGGITKQVFRNKVRRYKLLEEVSSQ